jgi:hypothetical protein
MVLNETHSGPYILHILRYGLNFKQHSETGNWYLPPQLSPISGDYTPSSSVVLSMLYRNLCLDKPFLRWDVDATSSLDSEKS